MPQAFRRILQVTLLLAGSLAPLSASADPTLLEPFEGLRYTDDLDSSHGMTWSRKTGTANGKET